MFFATLASAQTMYKSYSVVALDSTDTTPRYLVGYNDNVKPDTIGIVLTIKQAQRIDNDLDLLNLYRNMHTDCDSTITFLVRVVDDYKTLNILAQDKYKAYDSALVDTKNQIDNLKQQITINQNQLLVDKSIIVDKNQIISIDKLQIKHLKQQKRAITIGGFVISGSLFYLLIGHPGIK